MGVKMTYNVETGDVTQALTLHYRDAEGHYAGAFDTPQPDLIECDPPADARQVWDGSGWVEPIDDVRQAALIRVDAEAESARLRYMTAGAGQALTYQKKAVEAKECLATTDPQANAYPLLAAEIGITADTLVGVAQVVAENDALWVMAGAEIERLRLTAKAAIREAQSVAAIEAATIITWP